MSNLQPGFRFYPTEEELVDFYLQNKLDNTREDMERVIPVANVYSFDPSDLPGISRELCSVEDSEQLLFFCPRQEREAHGGRPARTTPSGYWKATGSPSLVFSPKKNRAIGVKKTMVFYQGRAPSGSKTEWKMNEYRALVPEHNSTNPPKTPELRNEFSVCRVYRKAGVLRSFDRRPTAPVSGHRAAAEASSSSENQPSRGTQDEVGGGADWNAVPDFDLGSLDWD